MTVLDVPRGFSSEAKFVETESRKGNLRLHESVALGIQNPTKDELSAVAAACREPNWDGFNARPVSDETIINAYMLLDALPLGFPRPSIGAEPDGDLTLEWYRSPRRTLSVSVNSQGELNYAALLGPSRTCGTEAFYGDVPGAILDLVWRVYGA
jgi:hypothetical protein